MHEPVPYGTHSAEKRNAADEIVRRSCLLTIAKALMAVALAVMGFLWLDHYANLGQQDACIASQARLAQALRTYAEDNGGRWAPLDSDWRGSLMPILAPTARSRVGFPARYWSCPDLLTTVFYERNATLAGQRVDRIDPDEAPLVIATWESADGAQPAYVHPGGSVFSFIDGHTKCYTPEEVAGLHWAPRVRPKR